MAQRTTDDSSTRRPQVDVVRSRPPRPPIQQPQRQPDRSSENRRHQGQEVVNQQGGQRAPRTARVVINRFGLLELDLCDRDLRQIPDAVFNLAQLEVLRVARNRLHDIPSTVNGLRRLCVLDAGNNELVAVDDALSTCVRLVELDLRGNRLANIPRQLPAALSRTLRTLRLAGNRFDSLSEDFGRLVELRYLDVSANRLRDLPASVGELQHLRVLNAADNGFDALPWCVCRLSNLETLDISRNQLVDLPPDFPQLKSLRELRLASNRLDVLPEVVCRTVSLVVLDVSDNSLTVVPPSLARLPRLTELNIQRNAVDTFPDGGLPSVERLNVSGNRLRRLSVTSMSRLRRLDADRNWLDEMPHGVFRLAALESLSVAGNRITHLSADIGLLTQLRVLDVSNNALTSLPNVLDRMENLVTLDITGNGVAPEGDRNRSHRHHHHHHTRQQQQQQQPPAAQIPAYVPNGVAGGRLPTGRVMYASPLTTSSDLAGGTGRHMKPNGGIPHRSSSPPAAQSRSSSRLRSLFRKKERSSKSSKTLSPQRHTAGTQTSVNRVSADPNSGTSMLFYSSSSERSATLEKNRRGVESQRWRSRGTVDRTVTDRGSSARGAGTDAGTTVGVGGGFSLRSRSRSVSDLATAAVETDTNARRNNRMRLENIGRLAASGINLDRVGRAADSGNNDDPWTMRGDAGSVLSLLNDSRPSKNRGAATDADSEGRCSDTVTINEAVGDELSLGEDDFEFLPSNVQDAKLMRVAADLEKLLNRQLLQPIITTDQPQQQQQQQQQRRAINPGDTQSTSGFNSSSAGPSSGLISGPTPLPSPGPSSGLPPTLNGPTNGGVPGRATDMAAASASMLRSSRAIQRSKEDIFVVGSAGGVFRSTADPDVSVYFPRDAISTSVTIVLQIIRLRPEAITEARRTDPSLSDVLSVGQIVRLTADRDDVILRHHVTITFPVPKAGASSSRWAITGSSSGKVHVLTYRGGRVDSTAECVPCTYEYRSRRGHINVKAWHLTGLGAVLSNSGNAFTACRSVEKLFKILTTRPTTTAPAALF